MGRERKEGRGEREKRERERVPELNPRNHLACWWILLVRLITCSPPNLACSPCNSSHHRQLLENGGPGQQGAQGWRDGADLEAEVDHYRGAVARLQGELSMLQQSYEDLEVSQEGRQEGREVSKGRARACSLAHKRVRASKDEGRLRK